MSGFMNFYIWLQAFISRPRNLVAIFILLILCFNAYGTYRKQHMISLADKVFATKRVETICSNAENVKLTNYGEKCRQYVFDSAINPHWEGIAAILDSWYIWDSRTGYTLGTVILIVAIFFMGGIIFTLHFCGGREKLIGRFNDYEDSRFIDNYPATTYRRPVYAPLQHNADCFKEA